MTGATAKPTATSRKNIAEAHWSPWSGGSEVEVKGMTLTANNAAKPANISATMATLA